MKLLQQFYLICKSILCPFFFSCTGSFLEKKKNFKQLYYILLETRWNIWVTRHKSLKQCLVIWWLAIFHVYLSKECVGSDNISTQQKKCRKTDIAHLKNRMYPRLHNSLTVRDNPIKTRITLVFLKILGHPIWNYCFYLCRISVVKYRLFFTHSDQNGYKFTEKICNSFVYFKDI